MSRLRQLISEVHRRSLWQVLAIYVAVSWAVLEAADQFSGQFRLPWWVYRGAFALLLVGLPIVLATAFFQRGLPAITRRDPTLLPGTEAAVAGGSARGWRRLFTWRNAFMGGLVAFALWGAVSAGWLVVYGGTLTVPAVDRKSVAVLPFANMSADPQNEYFSDGITDAIITHLTKIADLSVTSRTSSMQYKDSEKSLRDIAEQLGVAAIVEGGVQRTQDRVRINAQLIDAQSDNNLWAEIYERDLTDIFAVQSDVAQQIAAALRATLTAEEIAQVEKRPTENLEAYDYYLRGNDFLTRSNVTRDFRIAVHMYENAVELDPSFALAYARLSEAHSKLYWFHYDRSEERLAKAKEAVDRAFELEPGLPQAHQALGYYYYWGHQDYSRALEQFAIARKREPNNSELLMAIAYVRRRQGKLRQAAANLEKALELDPRSAEANETIGSIYRLLRDYAKAEPYYDRAISLSPDGPVTYGFKARLYLSWEGSTGKARAVLEQASQTVGPTDNPYFVLPWVLIDLFDHKYEDALGRLSSIPSESFANQFYFIPEAQLYAQIYGLMNRSDLERAYYDTARVILEAKVEEDPEDARFHSSLGIAYAGLGRAEEAIREGKKGAKLLPVGEDAWRGLYRVEDVARIYVMLGRYDAAVEQLEFLLSVPGELSIPLLRLDPTWSPLRSHPRFKALLEREQ